MKSPISRTGGKSRLAETISRLIPKHRTYVEPFFGAGHVFFRKGLSPVEVLNDIDGELITFFRVCQSHPEEFLRCIELHLPSRKWFEILLKSDPTTLTDINRAVRFYFLNKNCFGGKAVGQNYGYGISAPPRFSPSTLPEIIRAVHGRLAKTQIECLPYQEILKRYDSPETFFYLDPPYWLPHDYYEHNFRESDFRALNEHLHKLTGRFILSLNDRPEVRQIFSDFTILAVDVAYSCGRKKTGKRNGEVLIHNLSTRRSLSSHINSGHKLRRKSARA